MLIGSYFRWTRYHRDFVRREIPEIKAALYDGMVFVKKVSAEAVIEIVEFEDEGAGYIYDVGDGKILFLKGQRFFPVDDGMPWPNSNFEIVRTVHKDMWVGIFCSGRELTPVRELETSDCIDDIVWAEREEVNRRRHRTIRSFHNKGRVTRELHGSGGGLPSRSG